MHCCVRQIYDIYFSREPDVLISEDSFGQAYVLPNICPKNLRMNCEDQHRAVSLLNDLFLEYEIDLWLIMGTALGIYRDNQFINNDTDIDITDNRSASPKDVLKIVERLEEEGYRIFTCRNDASIGLYGHGAYISWSFPEVQSLYLVRFLVCSSLYVPEAFFLKPFRLNYKNKNYLLPDPDRFFAYWYGKNWRTPIGGYWDGSLRYLLRSPFLLLLRYKYPFLRIEAILSFTYRLRSFLLRCKRSA